MKTDGEIKQRLKQIRFRTIKKEIENLLKRTASNCRFNYLLKPQGQDTTQLCDMLEGGVYICKCPDYNTHICDTRFSQEDPAVKCPYFDTRHNKDLIKQSLSGFFDNAPVEEILVRFPQIATLLWVLQEDDVKPTTEED